MAVFETMYSVMMSLNQAAGESCIDQEHGQSHDYLHGTKRGFLKALEREQELKGTEKEPCDSLGLWPIFAGDSNQLHLDAFREALRRLQP